MNVQFNPVNILDITSDVSYCSFCSIASLRGSVHGSRQCLLDELNLNNGANNGVLLLNFGFYQCILKNCNFTSEELLLYHEHLCEHGIRLDIEKVSVPPDSENNGQDKFKCGKQRLNVKGRQVQRYSKESPSGSQFDSVAVALKIIDREGSKVVSSANLQQNVVGSQLSTTTSPRNLCVETSKSDDAKLNSEDKLSAQQNRTASSLIYLSNKKIKVKPVTSGLFYLCQECPYKTKNKKYLKRHIRFCGSKPDIVPVENDSDRSGGMNDSILQRKEDLESHPQKSPDIGHSCGNCSYHSNCLTDLKYHQDLCNQRDLKFFCCEKCYFLTPWKIVYDMHKESCLINHDSGCTIPNHIRPFSEVQNFKCEKCPFSTVGMKEYQLHIAICKDDSIVVYRCKLCNTVSRRLGYIKGLHYKIRHNSTKPSVIKEGGFQKSNSAPSKRQRRSWKGVSRKLNPATVKSAKDAAVCSDRNEDVMDLDVSPELQKKRKLSCCYCPYITHRYAAMRVHKELCFYKTYLGKGRHTIISCERQGCHFLAKTSTVMEQHCQLSHDSNEVDCTTDKPNVEKSSDIVKGGASVALPQQKGKKDGNVTQVLPPDDDQDESLDLCLPTIDIDRIKDADPTISCTTSPQIPPNFSSQPTLNEFAKTNGKSPESNHKAIESLSGKIGSEKSVFVLKGGNDISLCLDSDYFV